MYPLINKRGTCPCFRKVPSCPCLWASPLESGQAKFCPGLSKLLGELDGRPFYRAILRWEAELAISKPA